MKKNTDNKKVFIGKLTSPPPVSSSLTRPVRSAASARRYLSRVLVAYQRGEIDSQNARTSVYVLSEFLRAVEVSGFEERLDAIELKMKPPKK